MKLKKDKRGQWKDLITEKKYNLGMEEKTIGTIIRNKTARGIHNLSQYDIR